MTSWVFAGTQHPALARDIALRTGSRLGNARVGHFADGEISIDIAEDVRGERVLLVQPTPSAESILELVFLADALKRGGPRRLELVVPYFGYQRQERRTGRSPVSAQVIARMVNNTRADRIVTLDLHAPVVHRFFTVPHLELHTSDLFADAIRRLRSSERPIVVVSPDRGGVDHAQRLACALATGCPPLILDKDRPAPDLCKVRGDNTVGSMAGKHAILVDDAASTGGTLFAAAEVLEKLGASPIWACVTHLVGEPKNLAEGVEKNRVDLMLVTDSLPGRVPPAGSRIQVLSVAPLFAAALSRRESILSRLAARLGR